METIENNDNQQPTQDIATPTDARTEQTDTPQKQCCKKHQHCVVTCLTVSNIILLAGLVLIYIFHFTGIGAKNGKYNPSAKQPIAVSKDGLKVAYVDSDTLLAKYEYAKELQAGLESYQTAQQNNYRSQMEQFQKDYQDFLKNGDKLSLSQQQAKEAELKARAEKLGTLEAQLAMQVQEKQMKENVKLLNAIFGFIKEYNEANQQYDIILRKTFNDSPTLYIKEGMDITNEIVEGLNEEYKKVKANEEK